MQLALARDAMQVRRRERQVGEFVGHRLREQIVDQVVAVGLVELPARRDAGLHRRDDVVDADRGGVGRAKCVGSGHGAAFRGAGCMRGRTTPRERRQPNPRALTGQAKGRTLECRPDWVGAARPCGASVAIPINSRSPDSRRVLRRRRRPTDPPCLAPITPRRSSSARDRPAIRPPSMRRAPTSSRSCVQGLQPGGQLTITSDVENWPGDTSILGPALMDRMQAQAEHAGARLVFDIITEVDFSKRPFTCKSDGGDTFMADTVIIATGAQARWLGSALRADPDGGGRQRLRGLRRRFLPRQGGGRGRRRQHRGRGRALPHPSCQQGHGGAPARQVPRREDHAGPAVRQSEGVGDLEHGGRRDPRAKARRARSPACSCAMSRTDAVSRLATDGVFVAIGHVACDDGVPGPGADRLRRLHHHRRRFDRDRYSRACSRPATSRTRSTARP